MKKRTGLLKQFAWLMAIFAVVVITVVALATYFAQTAQYQHICKDAIMNTSDYLAGLMINEGEDFKAYKEYYEQHYDSIRIPCDFNEYHTAEKKFYEAFVKEYPGKTIGYDIMPQDMSDELQNLYYTYRHEYWLLTFEKARESYNLPYTYFLLPDEENYEVIYMIDGERTEDPENPGYLYMGDHYYNDPAVHTVLWDTWLTGQEQDDIYEWNNQWGHTYAYYHPLVIDGENLGLVVSEISVEEVYNDIIASTMLLCVRLAAILLLFSTLLLLYLNHRYIRRIEYLSEKIDDFSSKRAYETVDAIRSFKFGKDEIGELADNTADMISEIKHHEEEVKKAAKMKSDFLANMSHEIRTPMNAVIGMADLILCEEISDKARDYATQLRTSGTALLTIINDILDFSKIESGNMSIKPVDYIPEELFADTVNSIELNLGNKPLSIKLTMAPDLPERLRGDSVRIRQIVTNLLSNAVKFTAEGSIDVNVDSERINDDMIMMRIEVSDTGIGIKEDDMQRIFESFSQLDSTRNRSVEGTGLGLPISQNLVRLMNGTMNVESDFGKGSVFTVELPQTIVEDRLNTDTEGKDGSGGKYTFKAPSARILVVDDNQVNLVIADGLMDAYDIKPVCVSSGPEAIDVAGTERFDMILMDHMMPQMDGVEATHIIRERYPEYADVPVVAFTANAVEEARELLKKEGMEDFLSKPVEQDRLAAILIKWLPKDKIIRS